MKPLHLPPIPLRQTDREELLDAGRGSLDEVRRSLSDVARINTYLGGANSFCSTVFETVERYGRKATILDVGTGNADIPLRLVHRGQKRGLDLQLIGLDVNPRHLQIAREAVGQESRIRLIQGDAFALPLEDGSVDLVIATLFLHHFRPPQIALLLAEFSRVARRGWIINDIERDAVPLWFFRLVRPIFARSYITRFDGEASIRRAYTVPEMTRIVAGIEPAAHVEPRFPYRFLIRYDKQGGNER